MLVGRRTWTGWIIGGRALRRGMPALMVAVALAAGAGPGAAAARLGAARAGHGARVLHAGPAGVISTVAGGDGGPALNAQLFDPVGTAVDAAGNLLLADSGNNRIRVVAESTGTFYGKAMTAGNIYTVAGGGSGGLGDGGPALSASLHEPT